MTKRWVPGLLVGAAWVLLGAATALTAADAKSAAGGALVVTAEVVQREVAEGRTFVGTVLPSRRSVIGSAVEGRVLDLKVNDGDWVKEGETLAELRTVTIRLELDAAKAGLQLRKHELEESKYSLPIEQDQAKAAMSRTQALTAYAKSRLARAEALFAKGGTTPLQELEEARSVALATEQSAREAAAAYQLLLRPREEKILQAEAQVAKQEAEVGRLEDQLEKYTVRAPFDGYVTAKHTEDGAWIKQGEPVVELVAVDPVEVSLLVPEEFIATLHPGMTASVQLDALAAQVLPAEISRIVPQAEVRSRSFPVKMVLSNPKREPGGHLFKAGMLARVVLAVGQPQQAILVPKDALVLGGRTPVVFVVRPEATGGGMTAWPISVELGVADGGDMQIRGGLEAGQQVVVRGNERLSPYVNPADPKSWNYVTVSPAGRETPPRQPADSSPPTSPAKVR